MGISAAVYSYNLGALPYPVTPLAVHPLVVAPNRLPSILAMSLHPEGVAICAGLYIQDISLTISMVTPPSMIDLASLCPFLTLGRVIVLC